jgi:hypothetical protein
LSAAGPSGRGLAVGDVEAEVLQRVAHAARVVDRVGELVGMAVRGVADDESDALLRMAGRDGAEQHQRCGGNDLVTSHVPLLQCNDPVRPV